MRTTTYRCAGPDCTTHQSSTGGRAGGGDVLDFCTVDCMLRWAGGVEPVTVIEWERGVA